MKISTLLVLFLCFCLDILAQGWTSSHDYFYELNRRGSLSDSISSSNSIISLDLLSKLTSNSSEYGIYVLPINTSFTFRNKRPYNNSQDFGMIGTPGFQAYLSAGLLFNSKFLFIQFQPELVLAQNLQYNTYLDSFNKQEIQSKFHYWNRGDFPERFGNDFYVNPWWGQSKVSAHFGAFEIGASTQNIWWGPGQWNSLTFSNNAQGFAHLTLNTIKPAKTFLGYFETQLLIGKLNSSGYMPSQYPDLNKLYFEPLPNDWRYLNAIMLSYNPKWIPNLFLGFTRTFQQYSQSMGTGLLSYFPVFQTVTKDSYGYDKDENGQDQQITVFGRFIIPKSKSEFYFEYGRRDHAKNWREFTLNPEHARAYILGFAQFLDLPNSSKLVQIRGEITQQQESVNRYIRYFGVKGGSAWHTNSRARGFTNEGQPLGVGIGVGSNVQSLEFSLIEDSDKVGILFERLANNQDFYYKAQLQNTERKPWVDLSIGFLFDKKWDNLLLSSKLQIIRAHNYQWQLAEDSTPDFPKGKNLTSFMAQTSLIYFWNKDK